MAQTACEMMWLHSLLIDMDLPIDVLMSMYCNNQVAIYITNNPTFYERTKHIEVDYHYVREMMMIQGVISTPYTKSSDQFADIFTKGLSIGTYEFLCIKLNMIDMYPPV